MKAFFISIPHSGERVPEETPWLHGLPEPIVMCDVDRFVDRLYLPVIQKLHLPFVKTEWNRYVVDLNRLPGDVDADSVEGAPNASGKFTTGLHWVKTTRGTRLMPKPISRALHEQLVERYFTPFHRSVEGIYANFRKAGAKTVFHLDAHSMPSRGTAAHRDPGEYRADIVISDGGEGVCCEKWYKDLVIEAYSGAGLKVAYNWPYVGGRVTQTYGHPDKGQNAIQVEINRALYMDEESKQWIPERAQQLTLKIEAAVQHIYNRLPEI